MERLKKAVYVKSYSQADPLTEFRIEANRAFLGGKCLQTCDFCFDENNTHCCCINTSLPMHWPPLVVVLDAYREAVVERVMAPDFSVSMPVDAAGEKNDGPVL